MNNTPSASPLASSASVRPAALPKQPRLRRSASVLALLAGAALLIGGIRQAGAAPIFTEAFPSDAANWKIDTTPTNATWVSSGGPGGLGDGYITRTAPATITGQGTAVFRGQDNYNSSNNGFVRNWITSGVTNFTIDIRQDSGSPLNFYLRLATTANSPAASTNPFSIPSGVWTTINIPIVDSLGAGGSFQSYEGGTFNSVFSNLGKVQLFLTTLPAAGSNISMDNPTIVPEPGSLALLGAAGVGGGLVIRCRRSR